MQMGESMPADDLPNGRHKEKFGCHWGESHVTECMHPPRKQRVCWSMRVATDSLDTRKGQ